jgi:hypothetical protein
MASAAEELPEDLWNKILQHITNRQRLSACALVCRKLARAAAAATSVDLYSQQRYDGLLSWISTHGSSLTKLYLSVNDSSICQLPCPNLRQLDLSGFSVQLCAGGSSMGLLHSCTALTRLVLRKSTLLDGSAAGLAGGVPSAVAQLQHLDMVYPRGPEGAQEMHQLQQALQDRVFPCLTTLTYLSVRYAHEQLQPCVTRQISSMAGLQELSIERAGEGSIRYAESEYPVTVLRLCFAQVTSPQSQLWHLSVFELPHY